MKRLTHLLVYITLGLLCTTAFGDDKGSYGRLGNNGFKGFNSFGGGIGREGFGASESLFRSSRPFRFDPPDRPFARPTFPGIFFGNPSRLRSDDGYQRAIDNDRLNRFRFGDSSGFRSQRFDVKELRESSRGFSTRKSRD